VLNKELLSEQLRKIQTEDAQEVNRYFHWNTKTCCPGSNLFGIDLNGDIYGCHGMFYFKDVFKPLSTITSESVFKDLQIAQKELKYYTKERIHETISCPIKTITEGYTQ
jgi:radical SAM protein with 4Fe4S-binding SPASM domain